MIIDFIDIKGDTHSVIFKHLTKKLISETKPDIYDYYINGYEIDKKTYNKIKYFIDTQNQYQVFHV